MSNRIIINKPKIAWLKNDLTVCSLNMCEEIWALQPIIVESESLHLERMLECKTMDQSQEINVCWLADPRPKKAARHQLEIRSQVQ